MNILRAWNEGTGAHLFHQNYLMMNEGIISSNKNISIGVQHDRVIVCERGVWNCNEFFYKSQPAYL
ncbi:MAG TPA: hypothetical protein DD473_24830 [Planctomycetaceae bacterium]|nr:hypothetical protein [Planctomycetaceae bacterium]